MKKIYVLIVTAMLLGMVSQAQAGKLPYVQLFGQSSSVTCDVNCNAGIDYGKVGDLAIGFGVQTGGKTFVGAEAYLDDAAGLSGMAFVGTKLGAFQLKAGGGYFSSNASGNFGSLGSASDSNFSAPGLMVEAKFEKVFMRVVGYKADYDFNYREQVGVNPVTLNPIYSVLSDSGKSKVILYQVGVQFDG